jgi:TRAP-type C4-dicarboxylate transport system substrate-binding protein
MPIRYCSTFLFGTVLCFSVHAQEIVRLKVADNLPPTHFLASYGTKYFMEEVTKATGGRVAFDYFPSEQLGKARDLLTITQSGVADIGLVTPTYVSDKMPLSAVGELPGSFGSSCEGTLAFWRLARDGFLAKNEFGPNGVRVMYAYVNPPYQVFLGKRELQTPADLQGLKLRSVGGAQDFMLKRMGAVPVRLTAPEVREALSRGTVDGMVFPVPTVLSYDIQGLIRSATQGENFGSATVTYMISEARWQKLPEAARAAMLEVGERTTRRACSLTDQDVEKSFARFREIGMKLVRFSPAEREALNKVFAAVADDWANSLEGRGRPALAALAAFREALAQGRK